MPTDFQSRLDRINEKHAARAPRVEEVEQSPNPSSPPLLSKLAQHGSAVGLVVVGTLLIVAVPTLFSSAISAEDEASTGRQSWFSTRAEMHTVTDAASEERAMRMLGLWSGLVSRTMVANAIEDEDDAEMIRREGMAGVALRRMQEFEAFAKEAKALE